MRLKSLDRLEVTLLLCLITSERGSFRALKMRRVPQEAFLSTARIFGTVKACFWYRVLSHTEASCCRSGAWRTF